MAVPAWLQAAAVDQSVAALSTTVAYTTANLTANSLLTCAVRFGGNGIVTTGVSDNNNNTWVKAFSNSNASTGDTLELWHALRGIILPNAKPTVAITTTSSVTIRGIIEEYSAGDYLDSTGTGTGSSATLSATTSTAPGASTLLAIGAGEVQNSGTFTVGGSFTLGNVIPAGANAKLATEWALLTNKTAVQTATLTNGNQAWTMGLALFAIESKDIVLQNYQFVRAGDGISVSEKIR